MDPKKVIGLSIDEACEKLDAAGLSYRIDGDGHLTMDWKPFRLNLVVGDGVVTDIRYG